jgi:O-antigen/teichoic acid export membrane protein
MNDQPDDQPHQVPGIRQVARLVVPVFVASMVVIVIGVLLVVTHHHTLGLVVVVFGAVVGFAVRAWLVIRSQQSRRP